MGCIAVPRPQLSPLLAAAPCWSTPPPSRSLLSLPPAAGVIADVGITLNSSDTLAHVMASKPQLVWLIGG